MGDPKKLKKKYSTPIHPWNKDEIELNKKLKKEYGLKNRKDILIAHSFLKKYKDIAKKLIATQNIQSEKEKIQMMKKLQNLGLISAGASIDDVLSLELKNILERRLQTLVFRKGLSRSPNQARQFITHRHIFVGNKEITAPGYLVSTIEETEITFKDTSALADEEHPERVNIAKEIKEEVAAIKNNKNDDSFEESIKHNAEKTNVDEDIAKDTKEIIKDDTTSKKEIVTKETKEKVKDAQEIETEKSEIKKEVVAEKKVAVEKEKINETKEKKSEEVKEK